MVGYPGEGLAHRETAARLGLVVGGLARGGGEVGARHGVARQRARPRHRHRGLAGLQCNRIKTNEIPHNKCWMSAPDGRSDTQTTQSSFFCVFISSGTAPPLPSPLHSAAPLCLSILVGVSSGVSLSHFSTQHSTTHRQGGIVMYKSADLFHLPTQHTTAIYIYLVSKLVLGKGTIKFNYLDSLKVM